MNGLISPEYLTLQKQFHARPDYGIVGQNYADDVIALCGASDSRSVLDYGCGKATLAQAIAQKTSKLAVIGYDPAIPTYQAEPPACHLVACTDVLEHIEPDCLGAVLSHLVGKAQRAIFLAIHIGPARKTLPDGRNAHLIQEPPLWWLEKLDPLMAMDGFTFQGNNLQIFGRPL